MQEQLGQRLLKDRVITEGQLDQAINRQRLHGGRIGHNLVSLGFITAEGLETLFKRHPEAPRTVQEAGLELPFVANLIMKHVLFTGDFTLVDLSGRIKLPVQAIDPAVELLRREHFVEVKGAAGYRRETYNFAITEKGKHRAAELLELNRYTGAAPVTLDSYRRMVELQTIKNIVITEDSVMDAFGHIVISKVLLRRLGPAVSSGKAIFLYGPPGNGKTTIAETIGEVLPGSVYMPHSLVVGGEIISVFNPVNHVPVPPEKQDLDQRWLLIKRPVLMTGGELTLKMLDLDFNPVSKFYEAPLQMKANNGLFIVDDFGRQQMEPRDLLNRWIVPLEKRTDFMSLSTGMKFDVPFDQLIIFCTNIEPKKLVDEAFLRRIRYKIKIDHPTEQEYEAIFIRVCEANGVEFRRDVLDYLLSTYYKRLGVKLNACHPRDLIEHIIDNAHYYNRSPQLTKENLSDAWDNYFVEI